MFPLLALMGIFLGVGAILSRKDETPVLPPAGGGDAPPAGGPAPAPGATPAVAPPPVPSPAAPAASAGPPQAVLAPKPGKPVTAQRIKALGDMFDKVWTDVTGKPAPMPPEAKEVALAQASAEGTGFGQGWEMTGNVGSYQCGGKQQGTAYYDCVPHVDSRPDPNGGPNIQYTTTFRKYKDGTTPDGKARSALEAGAWDFLTSIAVKPFPALAELLAGDVLGYARKQYGQHYFEGFNLSDAGKAAYKDSIAQLVAGGVPVRRAGETAEQVAGRIVFYAAAMARGLPEIAAGLGYDKVHAHVNADLAQPWKASFQAAAGKAPAPAAVAGLSGVYGVRRPARRPLVLRHVLDQLGATEADGLLNWNTGTVRGRAYRPRAV